MGTFYFQDLLYVDTVVAQRGRGVIYIRTTFGVDFLVRLRVSLPLL